ncbi:flagellin FliC [Ectothiorhodospiraceae bacterium BW-2]|nr:flagellin FliC [Ectothiorhodospiraceae bacterium BW-2]
MSLSIYTNIASLSAQNSLSYSNNLMQTSMQRLSSGLRINSAQDDASGLAISRRLDAQVRGMNVAMRNASDGISMAQTAENALGQAGDMLQRMRELAVQAANGTLSTSDRTNLQSEYDQLNTEIGRVISSTEYNGKTLLNGSAGSVKIQIGADNSSGNQITVNFDAISGVTASGVANAGSVGTVSTALNAISAIDTAIDNITAQQATYGAMQSRFDSTINILRGSSEQTAAALGRIQDTDYATETANFTKMQILQQAGIAMLAQANQTPNNILSLLR